MISNHGSIQYFVNVSVKTPSQHDLNKFIKEIVVQAPHENNLMVK